MSTCEEAAKQERELYLAQVPRSSKMRQCEHIKANGEFCGSPALRGRNYCYFHLTHIGRRLRAERMQAQMKAKGQAGEAEAPPLELPAFEDAPSIQIALMQVVDAILHNRLDNKRAGLVLYALQTASCNLGNGPVFQSAAGAVVAGGYEDFEEDFQLGDSVPELKLDEEVIREEEESEHAAKLAEAQELAEAYARVDSTEREVCDRLSAREKAGEDVEEANRDFNRLAQEKRPGNLCSHVDQFFCRVFGPLAKAKRGSGVPVAAHQRDARSQRLEMRKLREEAA